MALIGLAVLGIRYIARYQMFGGRWVRSIAVSTVTLNWPLQAWNRSTPGRLPTRPAWPIVPHFGQTGPSAQRTLCRCARQASAVPLVFMKVIKFTHANDHVVCLKAIDSPWYGAHIRDRNA